MKVFRFMSDLEFSKLIDGEILINEKEHEARTNSIGFCFLSYKEHKPEKALHFLSGVVDTDKCVIFEVDENKLNESWGEYSTPIESAGNEFEDMINLLEKWEEGFRTTEYCTTKYSKKDFKIIKWCEPKLSWSNSNAKWKWCNYDWK